MKERKRLEGNGLWESSRMMLPEHKVAINIKNKEEGRKERPILDSQELELIESTLAESFNEHKMITILLYDEYEDVKLNGIVTSLHIHRREIKLAIGPGDWQWIKVDDIILAR
ncbi:YolD-like family protein [Paenibacillus lautus]|uniref:YolD-like family protein n=1 Tax=Paenibacillus lautus TaxID=1401 RepID=UPI002DB83F92|nr:YolD-like family protein [Paenibacillus lautus]MEC0253635.1 YolD-like family protein [Paenibacillus lautus]